MMRMRSRITAICMIVALATCMQACVIVPLPSKKLLTDERLSQLVVGTTTKGEVYATFGDQYFPDPGGSGVVYSKTRLIAFGVSAWSAAGFEAVENLYVEFDDQNILSHFEQFEFVDGKACVDTGICMIGDIRRSNKTLRSVSFARPPDEDLRAKQFKPSSGQCSVYLYGYASLIGTWQASGAKHQVCLNEKFTTELYSPDLYLNFDLPPGTYQLAVGNAFRWHFANGGGQNREDKDLRTVSRTFLCEPDTVHFLHIEERSEVKGFVGIGPYVSSEVTLDVVDARTGRTEVTWRSLASDNFDARVDLGTDNPNKGENVSVCSAMIQTE